MDVGLGHTFMMVCVAHTASAARPRQVHEERVEREEKITNLKFGHGWQQRTVDKTEGWMESMQNVGA